MITSNKIGKVRITLNLIDSDPGLVQLVFSKFIPLKAEIFPEGWVEYIGISEEFEDRKEGFITPQYDAVVKQGDDRKYYFDKFVKVV